MIQTFLEPKISLDEIKFLDVESEYKTEQLEDWKRKIGGAYPIVQINGYMFYPRHIQSFSISCNALIPSISLSLKTVDGIFVSKFYPTDGDRINVYIDSGQNDLKSKRVDFLLTSIDAIPSQDSQGESHYLNVQGVLCVPNLYHPSFIYYENKNSLRALLNVSANYKLGFASNVTETNDSSTKIQSGERGHNFIERIISESWMSEESFFAGHLDTNYYLNFVDLQKELNIKDFSPSIIWTSLYEQYQTKNKQPNSQVPFILSNFTGIGSSINFISGYSLDTISGDLNIKNGYRIISNYIDYSSKKNITKEYDTFYNISGFNKDNPMPLRGRPNESFWKNEILYKNNGISFENEYRINGLNHNKINLSSLLKMTLKVKINGWNPQITLFSNIPVMIINAGNNIRNKITQNEDIEFDEIVIDNFLSDRYVVVGYDLEWSEYTSFQQTVNLAKKEWKEQRLK